MMKIALLTVAICLAVAFAQEITAEITYRGSADCSDNTKIVSVRVYVGTCAAATCAVSPDSKSYSTVTRCYNTLAEVPLPSNAMTLSAFSSATCTGNATFTTFVSPGIAGCSPLTGADSIYFTACSSTSSGAMRCTGSLDCSSGCAAATFYTGKEGDCSTDTSPPPSYTYSCKVDYSRIDAPSPSAGPAAGSPVAAPSVRPVATPARRSSATQVAMNIAGLLISIIALVL